MDYTTNGDGPSIDLDWGEAGDFGTDSDVAPFSQSNEATHGCEGIRTPNDVEI